MIQCNLKGLHELTPGSYDIPIQILELFLQDTPRSIENANSSLEKNEIDNVYKAIHKIKPSLILIGIPEKTLQNVLFINSNCKDKVNLDQLKPILKKLSDDLDEIYVYLRIELEKMKN